MWQISARARIGRAILSLLVGGTVAALWPATSQAATGDQVATVHFSQDCASGLGVGVAYDNAGHLWISCDTSNPDLLRASAATGVVDQTYNIDGGLGALAYDASRNALWAGPGCGSSSSIQLISLDATQSVTGSADRFVPSLPGCLDDGLAYDGQDDTLYYSPDTSTVIAQYDTTGAVLRTFGWTGTGCYNSGLAIGGSLLFQGSDGCSHVWVIDKTTLAPAFDFDTQVAGDPNFRDEGLSCDTQTFAQQGVQVMWSKEAYSPNRATAFEIPANTCVGGGNPKADLGMVKTASPSSGLVGGTITYTLTVSNSGPDSSAATVSDTLPEGVSYVSDDDGCTAGLGTVTCPVGSLASGGTQVIHIVVRATTPGTATNTACVAATAVDENPSNDCSTATTSIHRRGGGFDHFTCYGATGHEHHPETVSLRDEFGHARVVVRELRAYCTPVRKNREAVPNRRVRLTCFAITARHHEVAGRVVEVTNQFGRRRLVVRRREALCLPALVIRHGRHSGIPAGVNHFECYSATGASFHPPKAVHLADEFGSRRAFVIVPVLLCNPASKNGERIPHPRNHLVCYAIKPQLPVVASRTVRNQFGRARLHVGRGPTLCVPSHKLLVHRSG